ncbi:hypothetical protein [Nostoc sp. XA010]|nr:hypothetical protein [Nostoc sp. XA010]
MFQHRIIKGFETLRYKTLQRIKGKAITAVWKTLRSPLFFTN